MGQYSNEFLAALGAGMTPEERLILCGFVGDPTTVGPAAWRPRPWRKGTEIVFDDRANVYTTVATFGRAGDGSFRRRTETFMGGRALMIDDVGTKVNPALISHLPPSARVETSPENYQWWYFLTKAETDAARFDGVIRAFISGKLLGADPGMSGITRVGRVPGFTNGKPRHKNWTVRIADMRPRTFSIEELLDAFKLTIQGRRVSRERLPTADAVSRNRMFAQVFKWLEQRGMLKRDSPDLSGWTEMHCPWRDDHTGAVDTGAAIREPAAENDYYGAFRCHHGHCADRGWAELTDWVAEEAAAELEKAAA